MTIDEFVSLAERVHNAEGMTFGSSSSRESRNADWARIVGIAHHGHPLYNPAPDPQWNLKDGGGGRPQSDDVVVSLPSRRFWDCIPSAGADGYRFQASGHGDEALPSVQNVYPPPVPAGGGVTGPAPMGDVWTPAHEAIRARMAGRSARELAEQLAYTFPDEQWGQKRTTAGQWSLDTIGRLVSGRLWAIKVWPSVTIYGALHSGHVHRQVNAVNHLGDVAPPVEPPTPPVEPPADPAPVDPAPPLAELINAIDAQGALIALLVADVLDLKSQMARGFDIHASSRYFGAITGTVKPKGRA